MTDRVQFQAEARQHDVAAAEHISQQNQTRVVLYSQKDVDNAKQFVDVASKMLGKLEIDHRPGICRDEILKAAANRHLSLTESKVLDGLANIEPNVQTAWQVPNHRAHLKAWYDTDFGKNPEKKKEAELAQRELANDRKLQTDIYFSRGDVTPEQLKELKSEIGRVQVAMHLLKSPEAEAGRLLKKFDRDGKGLSVADVDAALKSGHLSDSERLFLGAAAARQKANQDDLRPIMDNDPVPSAAQLDRAATLKADALAGALKDWAVSETRADKYNKEHLFFAAIEGYNGHGIGIKSRERFNNEMAAKDGSKYADYGRRPYND